VAADKLSDSVVRDILRLAAENKDAATIAQILDLHRLEVTAIMHFQERRTNKGSTNASFDSRAEEPPSVAFEPAPDLSTHRGRIDTEVVEGNAASGLYLGDDVELDTPVWWEPSNSRVVQNPHLMIMGESGSGKTYAAQCLVAEMAQAGIPSIIFDYGQSFELEALERPFIKYCNPTEHRIGEEGLALNPLQVFPRDVKGPNQVATRLADVFDEAFQLGDIQRKVLIDAAIEVYLQRGIRAADPSTWQKTAPNILALQSAIENLASNKDYPNSRNAAGLAARLTTFFMLASFRDEPWSWDQLINDRTSRVHVLQFRGLEGKTQRALVEMLLWHMFFHLKAHGQQQLRVFCILDEAHHLSFRENGPIDSLVREARKFGLGIIFASQQPEDFSPAAYSNSASKLIFQTSDPKLKVSRFLAGKADDFEKPDAIRDAIGNLKRGQAFFISRNRAQTIEVADFAKRSTHWRKS